MSQDDARKRATILAAARNGMSKIELAERYLLIGPSFVSSAFEEEMIEIAREVSEFFSISTRSMQLCGSAKLGFSLIKKREFQPGSSDLDIAILDSDCFARYLEIVASETNDLQDSALFSNSDAIRRYKALLSRGIIRSEILPAIRAKAEWDEFFNDLTIRNESTFSKITAAIYLSDRSFVRKQASAFDDLLAEAQNS